MAWLLYQYNLRQSKVPWLLYHYNLQGNQWWLDYYTITRPSENKISAKLYTWLINMLDHLIQLPTEYEPCIETHNSAKFPNFISWGQCLFGIKIPGTCFHVLWQWTQIFLLCRHYAPVCACTGGCGRGELHLINEVLSNLHKLFNKI